MKKILFSVLALACIGIPAYALENDSLKTIRLGQVDVYSPKETNLQNAPVSSTTLGADKINQSQIFSIRDISGVVPNFFIPDYGSCMSASPYVRGVGSRNSGQCMWIMYHTPRSRLLTSNYMTWLRLKCCAVHRVHFTAETA